LAFGWLDGVEVMLMSIRNSCYHQLTLLRRVAVIHAKIQAGHKILITGIGGGVALILLQICIAKGASVYVTSGDDDKIRKAMELGAKGGVNYKIGKLDRIDY
jgi:D-arabinose 1-dehydrogenase-like Zn-dependent alcohol dehydrogenase